MKKYLKRILDKLFGKFFYIIIRKELYWELLNKEKYSNLPFFIEILFNSKNIKKIIKYIPESSSQLFQDIVALELSNFKNKGFFVEFGAADGLMGSNTLLLEKRFNWNGILCEPGRNWHAALLKNRNVFIDTSCVFKDSITEISFYESVHPELSTIEYYKESDLHAVSRLLNKKYNVKTISLEKLLKKYNAPVEIDYLSIDTEGTEYEILSSFDFSKYYFNYISVEHNFDLNKREMILELLKSNGYKRILTEISDCDDWYIYKDLNYNFQ